MSVDELMDCGVLSVLSALFKGLLTPYNQPNSMKAIPSIYTVI